MMISTSKHYKLRLQKILISVGFILALFLYTVYFTSKEFYIYSYDFGQHYAEFIQVHDLLYQNGLISTLKDVIQTIQTEDYNLFSAFLLSPFSLISTSRISYLFAIIILFYLPSYYLYLKIVGLFNKKITLTQHFLITCLFFLSPTLLTPILRNESSIDGLVPILLIFYIFFRQILNKSLDFKTIFPLAILITLPPLLHRWYLPFSLSYLLIASLFSLYIFRPLIKTIFYYFFLSISSVGFFLLISQQLWKRFFLVDYTYLYQIYRFTPNISTSFNLMFSTIGYSIILISLISLYFIFRKKIHQPISVFLISIFLLCCFLFLRIQDMNIHHYYLVITPLLLIIATFFVTTNFPDKFYPVIIFIVILCNFIYPSTLNTYSQNYKKMFFFSSQDSIPWYFTQTNTVLTIISDLSTIKPNSVHVLSLELWFNASSIKYYSCYFNQKYVSLCPHIADVSYNAKIDGFPYSFLSSDYILLNHNNLQENTDPSIRNLGLFIINHPQYYQAQKIYYPENSDIITLYKLIRTPPQSDFDMLIKSILSPHSPEKLIHHYFSPPKLL